MSESKDFLVEIGTEELPPKALLALSSAFADEIVRGLNENSLAHATIERFASPRRMAVRVGELVSRQADKLVSKKGPALKAAYDEDGNPTKAALGFARSCGVDLSDIETQIDGKVERLVFTQQVQGRHTEEILPQIVDNALKALPIPKRMRWADLDAEFVRPVHWVLLLFGRDSIAANILDIDSGKITYGHRFHHPEPLSIERPSDYESVLRDQGRVEPDYEKRREIIKSKVETLAGTVEGQAHIDPDLLDEVCSLTEWPVPVMGSFDEEFLRIPAEPLMETMQKNQKYFPILDRSGSMMPNFIAVANIESADTSQVVHGNERVIRPRFKDAAFFWQQDLKRPLDQLIPELKHVVYQKRLGSLHDKATRLARLSSYIANRLGRDTDNAERAALLSKCDLLTDMVGEFGSLQGIMGKYYATAAGENRDVSTAIEQHYLPRHAGDALPENPIGQIVALADKMDTLIGIFAIGQKPSGDKDPFGLRRASLGVLKILVETPIDLNLRDLAAESAKTYEGTIEADLAVDQVLAYITDRLKPYYSEKQVSASSVDAVLAVSTENLLDIHLRVTAIEEFKKLPESESLSAAHKRCNNILKKAGEISSQKVDTQLFQTEDERNLYEKILQVANAVEPLLGQTEYKTALYELASLRESVDAFFDNVMVMDEDKALRMNRINLLRDLSNLLAAVAEISNLQTT